jgi:hypothetical protein
MYNFQPNPRYTIKTDGSLVNYSNEQSVLGILRLPNGFSLNCDVHVNENGFLSHTIRIHDYIYNKLIYDNPNFSLQDNLGNKYQLSLPHQHIRLNLGISTNDTTLHIPEIRHPQQFNSPPFAITQQNQTQVMERVVEVPVEKVVEVPVEVRVEVPVDRIIYQNRFVEVQNEQTLQQLEAAQAQVRLLIQRLQEVTTQQKKEAQRFNQIDLFSHKMQSENAELKDKARRFDELLGRYQEKTTKFDELLKQSQEKEIMVDELSAKLEEFQNQAQDLRLLKGELDRSRLVEKNALEAAAKAEAEAEPVLVENESLKLLLAAEQRKFEELRTAFEESKKEVRIQRENIRENSHEFNSEKSIHYDELIRLRAELEAAKDAAAQAVEAAQREAEVLRAKLAEEAEELQGASEAGRKARREVEGLRRELAAKDQQLEEVQVENVALVRKLATRDKSQQDREDALTTQEQEFGRERDAAQRQVEGLRNDLAAKTAQVEELRSSLAAKDEAAQRESERLRRQLAEKDTELQGASEAGRKERREVERLRARLAELKATQAQATQGQGESERLRLQLLSQLEAAKREASQVEELRSSLAAQAAQAAQAQEARREAEGLRRELAAKGEQVAQAEELLARLPELEAARGEAAELRARLAELEAAKAQAAQAQESQGEVEGLRRELATQAEALRAAQREVEVTQPAQRERDATQAAQVARGEAEAAHAAQREAQELRGKLEEATAGAAQARAAQGGVARGEAAKVSEVSTQTDPGSGGQPSPTPYKTSGRPLVNYRFELKDTKSANQKLLRLTYLGAGSYNEHSVDFEISAKNPLVEKVKHDRARSEIIGTFLFGKIDEFNNKNLRIDDTSIKRFFSGQGVPIETCGALPMDLLKAIIRTKRSQAQDQARGR